MMKKLLKMMMKKKKKTTKPGEEKLVDSSETEGLVSGTSGGERDTSGPLQTSTSGGPDEIKYEVEKDDDDLLEFDDHVKANTQTPETTTEAEEPETTSQPQLQLATPATLDAKAFQSKWQKLQAQTFSLTLNEPGVGVAKAMEPLLQQQQILIMASGNLTNAMKYFLYAQDAKGAYFLIESLTDLSTGNCKLTIKADNSDDIPLFIDLLKFTLSPILKVEK